MRTFVGFPVVFLILALPRGGSSQNLQTDLSTALMSKSVTPSVEIAFAGQSGSNTITNDKPGKCPVKTRVYTDGTEKFFTEKLSILESPVTSPKTFPPKTQFEIKKVDVHAESVQLYMMPTTPEGHDACVRVMLGDSRLSNPVKQIVEDITDVLSTGHARPRDGLTDVEIDMNVLSVTGPGSFKKGDIEIKLIPDDGPGIPRLEASFTPYKPGFKEQMNLPCGGYSSNRAYYTKTMAPGKFSVPGRDVADGGFVVEITNNSSHSINGDAILITSKINGSGSGIVNYFDITSALANQWPGESPSGSYLPQFTKTLGGTFFPLNSSSRRAYVQLPGKQDITGHVLDAVGTHVDIFVSDVPTKFDPAGNPTVRDTFVFHLQVVNKHATAKLRVPNPRTVCNKD